MRFKGNPSQSYVLVHERVLRDAKLSLKAKGLLAVILLQPVGEHLTITAIMQSCKDGRDGVTTAWAELLDAGYLVETGSDYEVRENPKSEPHTFGKTPKTTSVVVSTSGPTGSGGVSDAVEVKIAGIPEVSTGGVTANPETDAVVPVRNTRKKSGGNSGKAGTDVVPGRVVVSLSESSGSEEERETHASDLFGNGIDKERRCRMRKNPIADLEVAKLVFSEAEALGIDWRFYHEAILGWSDKKPRLLRDFYGWKATIEGAMRRDKTTNKLRTVAQAGEQQTKQDALLNYLSM